MGLDMYLEKKTYVKNWEHFTPKQITKISIKRAGKPRTDIDTSKIAYIVEEMAYWRKVNCVHNFFVENSGNGEYDHNEIWISRVVLEDLLDRCNKVIKSSKLVAGKIINGQKGTPTGWEDIEEDGKIIKDSSVAEELLPNGEGFFFGSQEYDEYYLEQIKYTREVCEKSLQAIKNGSDIYYQASW